MAIGKSFLMGLRPMREHATMHGDACSIFHLEKGPFSIFIGKVSHINMWLWEKP